MTDTVEAPQDWVDLWKASPQSVSPVSIEVTVMGHRQRASICGRCGSIVFDPHKSLHEAFHARIVEDPRYPYTSQVRKISGEPAYPPRSVET